MGFPTRKTAARAALIGVMLGGGLLYAGISQAQDAGAQDVQAERSAELVAATGGPASAAHLIAFDGDRAAVEARDDDVAPLPAASASPVQGAPAPAAQTVPANSNEARQVASVETAPHPDR